MSKEKIDLRVWIVGAALVSFVIFEDVRFGRRHSETASFPVRQVKSDPALAAPATATDPSEAEDSPVKFAKSRGTE